MKKLCLLITLACVLMSAGNVLAQRRRKTSATPPPAVESNAQAWKTSLSEGGGFTVLMPGQPAKEGHVVQTDAGPLPSFSLTLKTGMADYIVVYTDFPKTFADSNLLKSAYDSGRDNLLKSSSLTLVNERDISIDGYTGRQIAAEGKGRLLNDRIVAVGKRLYQVMIITRDYRSGSPAGVKLYETNINKFLDSFKLVNPEAAGNRQPVAKAAGLAVVDLGRVENSVYINNYFSFKTTLPAGWQVLEREVSDATLEVGRELVKGSDAQTNAAIDKSVARTLVLFILSKFPPGTPNVTHAMLQCGAERISNSQMTSSMYMESNKRLLFGSSLSYKLTRDIYPQTIAGLSFSAMDVEQSAYGMTVKQTYYSTMRKGYALFFVTTYFNEEDRTALEKILKETRFE